ncbi:thioester reductase domain-containing protein [Pseudomonas sp. MWU13-2100]|uniref:thioester reductase domain-containing protein n=1 Tax=Pseudomonas sp. MWU13-2100 TaxID=2935075 RepID=UPI00200C890A|nr:thioester reductase domain-containing protein [Pseudomonas sp. MWU13-2100]
MNTSTRTNNPLASITQSALRTQLRQFARQHLPAAMLPSRFVLLDALPKLPNGKVDRKRLPAIELTQEGRATGAQVYQPPGTADEFQLVQIWRDLLGVEKIGITDSFFDLGGNSLSAVQMMARVRESFGTSLSLRQLFEKPTVSALALMLDVSRSGIAASASGERSMAPSALLEEALLPADIVPVAFIPGQPTGPYNRVLLTGGTGYTGAFLLRELLDRSQASIDVLVRAADTEQANLRIRQNMAEYGLWRDADAARLHGIAADIGRPWLGLDRASYSALAESVDLVVHNGALSNYVQSYWQLKPVNVLGTLEVLRFACHSRTKPVHHISSLAVFPVLNGEHHYSEGPLHSPEHVLGGYQQTKWVADRLVTQAGERGLPVCIYRPGQICGSQSSGAASSDTFLNAVIKGCIQAEAALPFDITLEMVPVDFCAAAVAHIALNGRHHGRTFHLTGARRLHWQDVIDMIRDCGFPLRDLSYQDWYRAVVGAVERGEDNELAKYLMLFAEHEPSADVGQTGAALSFDTSQLDAALCGSGIHCRPLDSAMMATYLDYFQRSGFLKPLPAL